MRTYFSHPFEWTRFVWPLAVHLFAGCSHRETQTIPPAIAITSATPVAGHRTGGGQPRPVWKLPKGWEEVPASDMRVASFIARDSNGGRADLGILAFPGQAGGDVPNVNRWREQVGLKAVTETELATLAQKVEIAGQTGRFYEQAGENPSANEKSRILAAILYHGDMTWFFKMNGDDEVVAAQKPAFLESLRSFRFEEDVTPQPQGGSDSRPKWKIPPTWEELPPGQMQLAKFRASRGGRTSEVSVVVMGGDGGGSLANVNRWRQQMGLEAIQPERLASETSVLKASPAEGLLLDVTSADRTQRLVTVSIPRGGQTWFYKLLGETTAVGAEKGAFLQFVQSAGRSE